VPDIILSIWYTVENRRFTMSDMEYHTGKIRKLPRFNETEEEWAKRICDDHGWEDKYDQGWIETLREEGYDEDIIVVNINGNYEIWELVEHTDFDQDDMFQAKKNEDDTISFTMSFYNGGTCLSEMLEEAVKRAK
jgi:hypothetical protein